MLRSAFLQQIHVDSAGIRLGEADPFAITVMNELGLDITPHTPKLLDDLEDSSFDFVISLSPEAHHRALDRFHFDAVNFAYWPTFDPSVTDGHRDQILDAYRQVRDQLYQRILQNFCPQSTPNL